MVACFIFVTYTYVNVFVDSRYDRSMRLRSTLVISVAAVWLLDTWSYGFHVQDTIIHSIILIILIIGLHLTFREGHIGHLPDRISEDDQEEEEVLLPQSLSLRSQAFHLFDILLVSSDERFVARLAMGFNVIGLFVLWHAVRCNSLLLTIAVVLHIGDMWRRFITIAAVMSSKIEGDAIHTYGFERYAMLLLFVVILVVYFCCLPLCIEASGRWSTTAVLDPDVWYGTYVLSALKLIALGLYRQLDG